MKKLSYILLAIITVTQFTSCSSDDSNGSNDQNFILGKWQLVKITPNIDGEELSDCRKEETLTFFDNGNIENYFEDNGLCNFSTKTFQYSVNDDELTFSIPNEGINGDTYILKSHILSLTENKLEFQYFNDNEVGDYPVSQRGTQEYIKM